MGLHEGVGRGGVGNEREHLTALEPVAAPVTRAASSAGCVASRLGNRAFGQLIGRAPSAGSIPPGVVHLDLSGMVAGRSGSEHGLDLGGRERRALQRDELTDVRADRDAARIPSRQDADAGPAVEVQRIKALGAAQGVDRLVAAGNRALTHAVVQRQYEEAKTPTDVQRIPSFAGISDNDRLRLINVVLDQWWVGNPDEVVLERIWGSLDEDGLVRFVAAHPGLWENCIDRGADLTDLVVYRGIQTRFRNDILTLARRYLADNERLVRTELDALGTSGVPPGPDQAARIAALQAAGASLAILQRAQEAAKEARVGWRIGDGGDVDLDFTGTKVKYQVPFRPGEPPPLTEEPADMPSGDVLLYQIVNYGDVQQRYDQASAQLTKLTAAHPALFGFARQGSSAATDAFVTETDASPARDRITEPLRRVLADIETTRRLLGDDLDPLDLTPLHEQLYAGHGAIGGTVWTQGLRRQVAESLTRSHAIQHALRRLLLEKVEQLAFMLAPFTSGTSLLLLLGTATAAAGIQAYGSYVTANATAAAEGTAVIPGTELVQPGSAEFARMTAEADAIAFGLALLSLGAAGFQAWRAGAEVRALRAQARALVRQAEARGRGVTVNIGGAGAPHEPQDAINLNPQVPGTERRGITNLVQAEGERIGELFPPASVDSVVGYRLPPHDVIDWNRVAPGAARVMRPGGTLTISFQGGSSAAENLGNALRRAGFRTVTVEADVLVQAIR
jgi:hypothetical protein